MWVSTKGVITQQYRSAYSYPQLSSRYIWYLIDVGRSHVDTDGKEVPNMADTHQTPRKIVGISMSPSMAVEVKEEAAKREMSLRKLFEEMWALYKENKKS